MCMTICTFWTYPILSLGVFPELGGRILTHEVRLLQPVCRGLHREIGRLLVWEIDLDLPRAEGRVIPSEVEDQAEEQDQDQRAELHH